FEKRWISLERAPKEQKRPDHIIQMLDTKPNTLFLIESKDSYNVLKKVEENVGTGMIKYLHNLKRRTINAKRIHGKSDENFELSDDILSTKDFTYKTAVAYYEHTIDLITKERMQDLITHCQVNVVFCFNFTIGQDASVYINLFYSTDNDDTKSYISKKLEILKSVYIDVTCVE